MNINRFAYSVLILAALTGTLFVLAITTGWLRTIFRCESFGCISLAFLYLVISALITITFFICGVLFGPKPRLSSGLFAGGVSVIAMIISFGAVYIQNQLQIEQDLKSYEEACAKHPEICPEQRSP